MDTASEISKFTTTARHCILGTAGHIDHGKTSLVFALTGTITDRLPEEQRRGMTIELGFAELTLGETQFGVVDVPGHERFIHTMVSGATGIDLALIVVAADDSVMPQTREHVDILTLLGVQRGVVAITKIDAVDDEMAALVEGDVRTLLADTPFRDAPICPVSSITGAGLDSLRATILAESQHLHRPPADPPFHMTIDRVFTVQGRGTVVTGSVLRGQVRVGDSLALFPAGAIVRVRNLQAHGLQHDVLFRGQRAALNLAGIDRSEVARGFQLATPNYLSPSNVVGARIDCLPSCMDGIRSSRTARLGIGTTEMPVRIALLDDAVLRPGHSGFAHLRCGFLIGCVYGQRFILRDENAMHTIGGGTILQPVTPRRSRDRTAALAALRALETPAPVDRLEQVLRGSPWRRPDDAPLCARVGCELHQLEPLFRELEQSGRWIQVPGMDVKVVPAALDDLEKRLIARLERYHGAHADVPGWLVDAAVGWIERLTGRAAARAMIDRWVTKGAVKLFGKFLCLPAFAPKLSAADEKLLRQLVDELHQAAFQPPAPDATRAAAGVDRKRLGRLLTLAVAVGDLVPIETNLYLHAEMDSELRRVVTELIQRQGSISPADLRDAIGASRKFLVPFLEYLDRRGVTKRVQDRRVLADRPP